MKMKFRTVKTVMILGFLLLILFTAFNLLHQQSSTASAALIEYDSIVELTYANSSALNTPIHPLGGIRNIDIKVRYYNTVPDVFKSSIGKILLFGPFKFVFLAPVHLTVEDVPDWCTATIAPQDIIFDAFGEGGALERTVTMQVAVNKQSTALFPNTLKVVATGDSPDRHIKAPPSVSLSVSIVPGYVPLISPNPGQTIKKTGPGQTVSWNIKIANNGNGEALVRARVIDPPKGYIISVNPQTIIPSLADGDVNEKDLPLTVLPPFNFGYYNENVQIELELIPEFSSPGTGASANMTQGQPLYLTLAIQNRGFSTPGFEIILFMVAILSMVIIINHKKKSYYK
jgi:hypothetical protein